MGLKSENHCEEPQELEAASIIEEAEEFEETLRSENIRLYRQLNLKDFVAKAKKQDTDI